MFIETRWMLGKASKGSARTYVPQGPFCSVQVGTPQGFGVCLFPLMLPPDSWDASFQIGLGFPPANLFRRRCRLLKVSSALIYILTTNLQKKLLVIWVA